MDFYNKRTIKRYNIEGSITGRKIQNEIFFTENFCSENLSMNND